MKVSDIVITDFKTRFTRGFDYYTTGAGCPKDFVTDADIQAAYDDAEMHFNPALFDVDAQFKNAFLTLSAHFLCVNLQTEAQGAAATAYGPVASRGVGGANESYNLPQNLVNDPFLSQFLTTRYGQKYVSMIAPLLIGGATVVVGGTTP